VVDGPAARRFIDGDRQGAQRLAQQLLATTSPLRARAGEVTLVGAGPGDPELLTLKALRALQDADVILHDRLVPAAVLDLARRDAALICVGKAAGNVGSTQDEINALLIEHARGPARGAPQGRRPLHLRTRRRRAAGAGRGRIDFSVVPGITAAAGCAAYAGIPLTHRDHAHSVTFVTGHAQAEGKEPDWRALAKPDATAVFYMGLARLDHIVAKLLEHGAPATRDPGLVEQPRLILRAAVAQNGDDGVARAQLLRERSRPPPH
jgi:uroporphyrin-III C-methyltransferase/precorrin-2 dehydrogenase/sirohydrochlorin ferrochelatase